MCPLTQHDGLKAVKILSWDTHLFVTTYEHSAHWANGICQIFSGFLSVQCVMTDKISRWWLAKKSGCPRFSF